MQILIPFVYLLDFKLILCKTFTKLGIIFPCVTLSQSFYFLLTLLNCFWSYDTSELAQDIIFNIWNSVVFLIQPSIPQLFAMEVTNKHLTVCNEQQTLREKCPNTKSVYFWSVFSFIRTEYGDLFPYKGSWFSAKTRISTLRNTFHIWLGVFRVFLEHVYMRTAENSNRFDISLQDKVSRRCKVTSLSAFTRLRAAWNSLRCKFHFSQIDQSEISNRSEFSM